MVNFCSYFIFICIFFSSLSQIALVQFQCYWTCILYTIKILELSKLYRNICFFSKTLAQRKVSAVTFQNMIFRRESLELLIICSRTLELFYGRYYSSITMKSYMQKRVLCVPC